jgi:hypothetical protein
MREIEQYVGTAEYDGTNPPRDRVHVRDSVRGPRHPPMSPDHRTKRTKTATSVPARTKTPTSVLACCRKAQRTATTLCAAPETLRFDRDTFAVSLCCD